MAVVEELLPPPAPAEACAQWLGAPYLLFLDSARDPERLGRYSFLSADPAAVLVGQRAETRLVGLPESEGVPLADHVLAEARRLLDPHRRDAIVGLPPFQGGIAGYIGYDWGAVLERLPAPRYDDLAIPDAQLALYDWVIAWDHQSDRAWVISTGLPARGDASHRRAVERLESVKQRLSGPAGTARTPYRHPAGNRAPAYPVTGIDGAEQVRLRSSFTHRGYLDALTRVREYIVAGDIFQANLSQRLEAPLTRTPWSLYERLRTTNPAPFAAYLDFDGLCIASASPERFLRVDRDGNVEARPIKGTRPRGVYPAHDAALARALSDSEKDRAENLMIVDLLRNDISRVCKPGTVRVPELFALEHYSTVHHLVSTVTGELAPSRDAIDLLMATFPGGSITGAPKVRAMEIIAELEPSRRGVYCGSIVYLSTTGAMDASIVIRTYLALADQVYFSVGGGIVADSDPEQEYRETFDKARALIAALR